MGLTRLIKKYLSGGWKREALFVVSLVILGTGTLVFAKLTDDYLDQEEWIKFDEPINQFIYKIRNPILARLMLLVTVSSNWQMIILGTVMVGMLLVVAHRWRYFWVLLISNVAAVTFIEGAKNLMARPRPPMEMAVINEASYSFPSGHSYFAGVFYGLLTYLWVRHLNKWRWRVLAGVGGVGWMGLLAFSRIYLGVHWMTDVVAGVASGGVWLTATIVFMEIDDVFLRKEERRVINKKKVYTVMACLGIIWWLTLGLMFADQLNRARNLGTKMIRPTTAAEKAEIRTAPAAASRIKVVEE